MESTQRAREHHIWLFAFGYFLFYIPYAGLIKLVTNGSLGDVATGIGVRILPATIIGTVVTVIAILSVSGWTKYARLPLDQDNPSRPVDFWTICSGVCTAVIIATTTLAYTFSGVSIVFALLLMRGGVLMMAPIIDHIFKRSVYLHSWLAFFLSLAAVAVALIDTDNYILSGLMILNLSAYLCGYMGRLKCMTRFAKLSHTEVARHFFVREQMVAMPVLLAVPALLALFGVEALQDGFTGFLTSELAPVALLIGVFYGCLLICGSMIYLDARENTFCIPVNRCASLLSGLAASSILTLWFEFKPISPSQLLGSGMIIAAVAILWLLPRYRQRWFKRVVQKLWQQPILFICSGNTVRSPMAQALCAAILARHDQHQHNSHAAVPVASAGLTAHKQAAMPPQAAQALKYLGANLSRPHQARQLQEHMVERAQHIICMTQQQLDELLQRYPQAASKAQLLDSRGDIVEPKGRQLADFLACARRIQYHIDRKLHQLVGNGMTTASHA